ncbi:MAG: hypothetical protein JSS29_01000 [Proteobacteria bacterium]|nr:hypothetical protein [Pseudomonadota bacterium]
MVSKGTIGRALMAIGAVTLGGCAHHHAVMCPNPAKVIGTKSGNNQEGWVLVRDDRSADETAERIATTYHVRTQPLSYVHGFSTFPVPTEQKFLCDKALVEVHYVSNLAYRR